MSRDLEKEKQLAAKEAVKYISPHQIVGLGSGSTAFYAIREIGAMVKQGFKMQGVATSNATTALANSLHIPLVDINTVDKIDITIDGADEFTPRLELIKGGGGALVKEKIIASLTSNEIIIADSSKKVNTLGKFRLPVAVLPFATRHVMNQLNLAKGKSTLRTKNSEPFTTDEGNYIIDTDFGLIADPGSLSDKLNNINGVVAHGLFLNLASKVIMGKETSAICFTKS